MENIILDDLLNDDFNAQAIVQMILENIDSPNFIEGRNNNPVRKEHYVEDTVANYSLSEFKSHFRMSREYAEQLAVLVAPHLPERHIIPIQKQVLFSVWILSKPESFIAAGDRFSISSGTGHYIFMNFIKAVCVLKETFIRWPNQQKCNETASRVENRFGIPGVIGAIGGTHIQIKQPTNNAVDYFNRKDAHSIILQAVANDKLEFIDVFIGMPGRMHNACVFRNSPLYHQLTSEPQLIVPQQHILGDAAYPLSQNLIKPFRDNGHLNRRQLRFNEVISDQRAAMIERSFALLKGKWRRLKFLDMSLAHKIPDVILAACILHNFVLNNNTDEESYDFAIDRDIDGENREDDENVDENDIHNDGDLKRNYHASLLIL